MNNSNLRKNTNEKKLMTIKSMSIIDMTIVF